MDRKQASRLRRCLQLFPLLPFWLRAVGELAFARNRHRSLEPRDIFALNAAATGNEESTSGDYSSADIERIAFVIPRVAARVPWRADCLVQAMAAQHWLLRKGISSQISIGVDGSIDGDFAAHAWLKHNNQIITGGEVSRFTPLLLPDSVF